MQTRNIVLVALFAALLAISANIAVPIGPVPFTLQTVALLLAGMILGAKLGALSVLVWVLLGIFGLPVFAGGKAGAGVLLGPTGGFILGYFFCAYTVGYIAENFNTNFKNMLLASFLGQVILFSFGVLGFVLSFKYFLLKPMSLGEAFKIAVAPFLFIDFLKTVSAAYLGVRVRSSLVKAGYLIEKIKTQ